MKKLILLSLLISFLSACTRVYTGAQGNYVYYQKYTFAGHSGDLQNTTTGCGTTGTAKVVFGGNAAQKVLFPLVTIISLGFMHTKDMDQICYKEEKKETPPGDSAESEIAI